MAEEETDRAQAADFLARRTQSYLERGRRLQGLTDAHLASKWVSDFRSWRASRAATDDPGNFADLDDIAAELRLRNLEAPYDQVQSEVNAMVLEIERIGPDQPAVSAKVQQFLDGLSKRPKARSRKAQADPPRAAGLALWYRPRFRLREPLTQAKRLKEMDVEGEGDLPMIVDLRICAASLTFLTQPTFAGEFVSDGLPPETPDATLVEIARCPQMPLSAREACFAAAKGMTAFEFNDMVDGCLGIHDVEELTICGNAIEKLRPQLAAWKNTRLPRSFRQRHRFYRSGMRRSCGETNKIIVRLWP
jgi:hypothetical protein